MNVMRSPQKIYIKKRYLEKRAKEPDRSRIANVAVCDSFKEACELLKKYQKADKHACYYFQNKPSSFSADPPCQK
tara:strand:- start:65 stop:289 length:225 start_codon:yes stop_codon:yes gene_type:complete